MSEDLHCLIAERHDLHIEHRTWSGNKSINGHNHLQTLFYDRFHMLEHHPCALPGNGGLLPLSFLLALYSFQIVDATSCTDEKKVYIAQMGGKATSLFLSVCNSTSYSVSVHNTTCTSYQIHTAHRRLHRTI